MVRGLLKVQTPEKTYRRNVPEKPLHIPSATADRIAEILSHIFLTFLC